MDTGQDLEGTGLTQPLPAPNPAALPDVSENILMIDEPEPSANIPPPPHAAPPPPGQNIAPPPPARQEQEQQPIAQELTCKYKYFFALYLFLKKFCIKTTLGTYITQNKICLTDGIIDQIIAEQQPKALTNWTGFAEKPTTKEDAIKAIRGIPKKFNIKMKKPPASKPLLQKGVQTELAKSMGLLSGEEAKQLANYLKRFFFRNIVYVSVKYFV